MLSVPSMRDRMVLGELNLYLQDVFPEAVNHDVPNKYINDVADFLAEHSSEKSTSLRQTSRDSLTISTWHRYTPSWKRE